MISGAHPELKKKDTPITWENSMDLEAQSQELGINQTSSLLCNTI